MKLERAQEYLTTFVAVAVGMAAAYYVGTLSGHGRFGMVVGILATSAYLALLMALREQIWLLIPFSMQLVGQVEELKGHPAIRDLAVIFVFGGVFALRAFKIIRRKPSYRAVDFWTGAVLIYLFTVYIRNPVGGEALGSARVGGRPYLDVFTATLAYWVLARVVMPSAYAVRAFVAVATLSFLANLMTALEVWFPITVPIFSRLVGGDTSASESDNLPGQDEEGRKFYLSGLGLSITQGLIAAFPPPSLLNPFRIIRFLLFATGFACLLLAGFRSYIFNLAIMFLIATYLRDSLAKAGRMVVFGLVALTLVVLMQGTIIELPVSIQRALSFLPGKWDRNVVIDAQASSSWRFEMWERMLSSDRYISSKWLGDGFGMTALQLQQATSTAGSSDTEQQKENFLINGVVHSGPISTIRYVGYVGLFLFMCLIIAMAREAWLLCRLCKGTPYFAFALYIGVPVIYQPFNFVLIYGAYNTDLPNSLVAAGMLKMLRTSIEAYRAVEVPRKMTTAPAHGALAGASALPAHMRF